MTKRNGFTLVELLVAIGLVLILMIGVSRVFKITSETVSTNQGISDNTRNARAAQSVFAQDLAATVTADAPCMLLYSRSQAAFRNRADQDSDRDADPLTIDVNGNNAEGENNVAGEDISRATYNSRNHRTDIFSFFTRGLLQRQTGGSMASNGNSPFIADMSSAEGWIWLGHLRIVNNSGSFTTDQDPGQGTRDTNPNNFFATSWILGREQVLLREPDATGLIKDNKNADQIYIATTAGVNKSPLSYTSNTQAAVTGAGTAELRSSRYDLAGTSIASYTERLKAFRDAAAPTDNWWSDIFLSNGRRFQANPFIVKPINPANLSQQAPIFMRGCSQFIVEYAGDYLIQDNNSTSPTYGAVTGVYYPAAAGAVQPTDNVIDYVVVGTGANRRKMIRWYGFPRDVSGDGRVPVNQPPSPADANQVLDVVPLRDIWRLAPGEAAAPGAPFEKFTWTGLNATAQPTLRDYGTGPGNYTATPTGGVLQDQSYTCAWGREDPKPKMIRITYTLDDPAGRTAEGQTFECVFEMQ